MATPTRTRTAQSRARLRERQGARLEVRLYRVTIRTVRDLATRTDRSVSRVIHDALAAYLHGPTRGGLIPAPGTAMLPRSSR